LWRTLFKLPRRVKSFHEPLRFDQLQTNVIPPDELAHWGRIEILDDQLILLHRDGTTSYRTHYVAALHGANDLKEFEQANVIYNQRRRQPRVKSTLHLPGGGRRKAVVQHATLDRVGTRQLLVTHTHLRPGVVLENDIADDFFQPFDVAPGVWGKHWLHTRWPCARRRLTIGVAAPFTLTLRLAHGAGHPETSRVGAYTLYRWDLANTPGIEPEPWTPPAADFCPLVEYSTLPSWEPVAEYFRRELDPHCVDGHGGGVDTHRIVGAAATARDKVARVYDFACSGVRYGRPAHEMEQRTVRSGSRIAEDLQGDCKDKSALMAAMLREVNVPTDIAVVLTNAEHGIRPRLPAPRFDHAVAVAHVDGQELWLDAAPGVYSIGVIPYPNEGAGALLIRQDGSNDYVRVPRARPADHGVTRACHGSIDADGNFRYTCTTEFAGERAAQMRLRLVDRNAAARQRILELTEADLLPGAQVESVHAHGDADLQGNVHMTCTALLPRWARPLKDLLLLRLPWAEARVLTGLLSLTSRQQPLIALPPALHVETLEIELPPEYAAYGVPWEWTESCPWSTYHAHLRRDGRRLTASRRVEDHPPESLIPAEGYPAFRTFWSLCAQRDATDVVLYRGESPF
jgi:hypothetical protein